MANCFISQEFRTVMSQRADLRSKLEAAVRAKQAAAAAAASQSNSKAAANAAAALHNPTIKLKTDFSNFK